MTNINNAKSIALMQPYLFPYLAYYQLIKAADIFVIYDDVNYINKGFINRNSILINNKPHTMTLSLCRASQNKLINEIEIGNDAKKILKTIEMTYKKAPYFKNVFPILNDIFLNKEKNLAKFVGNSLQVIVSHLAIKTQFLYSSDIEKNNLLKAQSKIIEMCKILRVSTYINPIGGQKLYDRIAFKQQNVELYFLQSRLMQYMQFKNEFVPHLSMIDVLMFNETSRIITMLEQYKLI